MVFLTSIKESKSSTDFHSSRNNFICFLHFFIPPGLFLFICCHGVPPVHGSDIKTIDLFGLTVSATVRTVECNLKSCSSVMRMTLQSPSCSPILPILDWGEQHTSAITRAWGLSGMISYFEWEMLGAAVLVGPLCLILNTSSMSLGLR